MARLSGLRDEHALHPISTGKLEGFNNRIKVAKKIGYGYRSKGSFFSLILYISIPSNRGINPIRKREEPLFCNHMTKSCQNLSGFQEKLTKKHVLNLSVRKKWWTARRDPPLHEAWLRQFTFLIQVLSGIWS